MPEENHSGNLEKTIGLGAILVDDPSELFFDSASSWQIKRGSGWSVQCVSLSTTYRDRFESYAKTTYKLSYPNSSTQLMYISTYIYLSKEWLIRLQKIKVGT